MIVGDAKQRARDAIAFSNGLQEAGLAEIGRQLRLVASDVLELCEQVDSERSARRSIQAQRDQSIAILERCPGEQSMLIGPEKDGSPA